MSIIKNVLFAVLIVVILQSVLLFNASAEPVAETTATTIDVTGEATIPITTIPTTSKQSSAPTTTVSKKANDVTQTSTKKAVTYTKSNNTKRTTTHEPVPYYLKGQTYASSTSADPNATTAATVKKTSGLGKSFYNFVWFYIPIIILCVAGLIFVNTKMAKKNSVKAENDNEIYSQSKKSKQTNKKRIK